MKLIKHTAILGLLAGTASAQGLFNLNPNAIESDSSPLKYTLDVALGYDDHLNPTSGTKESSGYLGATVGANLVVRAPRTSWDVNAAVGYTTYFDASANSEETSYTKLAFNLNHRFNNRARLVSRNFINYGIELGGFYGPVTSRQTDEFLYVSTDQAIGYRWTDRLATYSGVFYSSLNYEGSATDVDTYGVYNSFRYSMAPKTVGTLSYRLSEADYASGDRSSQVFSLGLEHSLSPTSTISGTVGAQFTSDNSPYIQLAYTNRITGQLKARMFGQYSIEDTDTVLGAGRYDAKTTFRFGAAADYTLSEQVTLTVGGSHISSDYEKNLAGGADGDWDLFNAYVSASYKLSPAVSMSASYNFTTSDSSANIGRNYDRSRFQISFGYSF